LGAIDDVTFAADVPPAASTEDALRRSLRCEWRPTRVTRLSDHAFASPEGWYSDYCGSPPPTRRTRRKIPVIHSTRVTGLLPHHINRVCPQRFDRPRHRHSFRCDCEIGGCSTRWSRAASTTHQRKRGPGIACRAPRRSAVEPVLTSGFSAASRRAVLSRTHTPVCRGHNVSNPIVLGRRSPTRAEVRTGELSASLQSLLEQGQAVPPTNTGTPSRIPTTTVRLCSGTSTDTTPSWHWQRPARRRSAPPREAPTSADPGR
jgi:hypothetical protein